MMLIAHSPRVCALAHKSLCLFGRHRLETRINRCFGGLFRYKSTNLSTEIVDVAQNLLSFDVATLQACRSQNCLAQTGAGLVQMY